MARYFIRANSMAAPFFSDTSEKLFISEKSPEEALTLFRAEYSHPYGLYSARLYASADAYYDEQEPLASWDSPECLEELRRKNA